MNYVEFQELIAKRNISLNYDIEDFREDVKMLKETVGL
ncbi:MAG TPA: hypothetical protein DCF68_13760 [Cyanothece sp. UBA12306]|nr:hypothetical protein [Cyanothece sp. UBA12306]